MDMVDRLFSALIGSADLWQKGHLEICGHARRFIGPGHNMLPAEQIGKPACRGGPEKALHIGTRIILGAGSVRAAE